MISRAATLLQGLRNKLQIAHVERLRRTLQAEITFEPKENGEFDVVVTPHHPSGSTPFRKSFTKELCFQGTLHLSPQAWAIQKRACDYAQDLIREVLQFRGIL